MAQKNNASDEGTRPGAEIRIKVRKKFESLIKVGKLLRFENDGFVELQTNPVDLPKTENKVFNQNDTFLCNNT